MIYAIIAIIIGALLVIKTEWIVNNFGYVDFAERAFRVWGGTRMFWKLTGIAIILIALLSIGGVLEPLILNTFGSLFGGLQRGP